MKLTKSLIALAAAATLFTACSETATDPVATADGLAGVALTDGKLVGTVTDADGIFDISAEVIDANGDMVTDVFVMPAVDTTPAFGAALTSLDLAIFEAAVTVEETACNGSYQLVVGYYSMSDTNTLAATDTLDLPAVTTGIDCADLAVAGTDTLWHPLSSGRAAYDLVAAATVAGNLADATKDVKNTTDASVAMDGVLESGNGATFAIVDFSYATATTQDIAEAAAAATFTATVTVATGDVVLVKLASDRDGGSYVLMNVVSFDAANNDKTTGANTGRLVFEIKK